MKFAISLFFRKCCYLAALTVGCRIIQERAKILWNCLWVSWHHGWHTGGMVSFSFFAVARVLIRILSCEINFCHFVAAHCSSSDPL